MTTDVQAAGEGRNGQSICANAPARLVLLFWKNKGKTWKNGWKRITTQIRNFATGFPNTSGAEVNFVSVS